MKFPKCLLKQKHPLGLTTETWVCGLGQANLKPEGNGSGQQRVKPPAVFPLLNFPNEGNLQGYQVMASKSQFTHL